MQHRRKHGVTRDGLAFHSFRKTFTEALERAGVSENVAAQLLGHVRGFTFGTYSPQGLTLAQRQEAVEKVAFDLKPDE